ncbi:MAG: hypothetical protein R3C44_03295 [Chloroflexota bacterium]
MDNAELPVKRATLQARLAAERANFFTRCAAWARKASARLRSWKIDGTRLSPHLGYWDAFYTDRIQRLIDGRRKEIRSLDGKSELDDLNTAARQQFSRLDLNQAMAIALKERNAFLTTLARVPDDMLFRRVQLSSAGEPALPHGCAAATSTMPITPHRSVAGESNTAPKSDRKGPSSKIILRPSCNHPARSSCLWQCSLPRMSATPGRFAVRGP